MAIAIFLKTESCDEYLFCFDHDDIDKAISACKSCMHEEFSWVSSFKLETSKEELQEEYRGILRDAVYTAAGERNE